MPLRYDGPVLDQRSGFGSLLRRWRQARRLSQEQLAEASEVSTRHISYLETGKSAASREMVLLLTNALDLPLRERNILLTAAGYAPVYRESNLDAPEMEHVRNAIELILAHHEPYPAIVFDRTWQIVQMNPGALRVFGDFIANAKEEIVIQNAMHAIFHPEGLRRFLVNWDEVAGHLLDRLYREAMTEPQGGHMRKLLAAVEAYPEVPGRMNAIDLTTPASVCIPVHLKRNDVELRLFTTLTTLGTPLDVTAEELRIESYFPADPTTAAWLASTS